MAVDVRWATTADAAALAAMLCEMAVHYRQPPLAADRALAAAQKWLAEESPAYPHFALAFVEGEVSGLASVAIAHPGIDLERPVVTTCGSGVTASVLLFAMHLLGKEDTALYDGSWSEWGADPSTPKATGPAA